MGVVAGMLCVMRFLNGDLFGSKAQTLANPVNCAGVMGKGLAKGFRERWPAMFEEYRKACREGRVRSGRKRPRRRYLLWPAKG